MTKLNIQLRINELEKKVDHLHDLIIDMIESMKHHNVYINKRKIQ